jgi:SAM-dependent methyltransferase
MIYKFSKNILKSILSKNLLFKYEESFRKILYPIYKGTNCECNICKSKLRSFEVLDNGNLLCPICGSLPRTRRLWMILNSDYLTNKNISILDFSPSRSLFGKLKNNKEINYFPTDFADEFLAVYHFDITKIDTESKKFDLIICYHILEHIEEDSQAMKELFRVLKPGGTCLVQTPFKVGEIYEDATKKSDKERLEFFGQEDHVRIYSVNGLVGRLENTTFEVETKKFKKDLYFGMNEGETVLFAHKK